MYCTVSLLVFENNKYSYYYVLLHCVPCTVIGTLCSAALCTLYGYWYIVYILLECVLCASYYVLLYFVLCTVYSVQCRSTEYLIYTVTTLFLRVQPYYCC